MNAKYTIISDLRFCIETYEGEISPDEIIDQITRQQQDAEYLKCKKLLLYFRKCTKPIDIKDLKFFIDLNKSEEFINNLTSMAIVADSPATYISNYIFAEGIHSKYKIPITIFSTLNAALKHLGLLDELKRIETTIHTL